MKESIKSWMRRIGASNNDWRGAWSYINEEEKFVVFGAWNSNFESERILIFSNDWEFKEKSGKRPNGFIHAKNHIERVEKDGFTLYVFKQYRKEGEEKRADFDRKLFKKTLVRQGNQWYAVSAISESMESKFRDYLGNEDKVGKTLAQSTIDTHCSQLRIKRLSDYPDIQAKLEITSFFKITNIEQYQRIEQLLIELHDAIKEYKLKARHKKNFNLTDSMKYYKAFLIDLAASSALIPEEVLPLDAFVEGATKTITVNAYERNSKARDECLQHHGYVCMVCGFDFESTYGDIGKAFIHVHHLVPLADIKEEYQVDPVEDLVPVCPNCHAMLHRQTPPLTIEELQKRMKKN